MMRAGLLFLFAAVMAAPAAPQAASACPATTESACMLDAIWTAASGLPPEKAARLNPLFVPLIQQLPETDRKAWDQRLGRAEAEISYEDYARRTAEAAVRDYGWDGFLKRARDGAPPLHMGRPEIMAAAIELAPDSKKRATLVDMMFSLAGTPVPTSHAGFGKDAFERADFGHVLAERMMRDCNRPGFDRAVALTNAPDSLRYALWRARIAGRAGTLAPDIRAGDGTDDTSHVRQAIEGYGAVIKLGYCPK